MKTEQVIQVAKLLEKFPIEVVLVKHLINDGVDTEDKLVQLLKNEIGISQAMKVSMQNSFRDIQHGTNGWTMNKIPNIFK